MLSASIAHVCHHVQCRAKQIKRKTTSSAAWLIRKKPRTILPFGCDDPRDKAVSITSRRPLRLRK
eukprot:2489323-Amphidinium_carterae.1